MISMQAVWEFTNGKVCDTGCHAFDNGKCAAYKKLTTVSPTVPIQEIGETVKQEAARMGLSISEVRRQRKNR
jgi:hypothetical protein